MSDLEEAPPLWVMWMPGHPPGPNMRLHPLKRYRLAKEFKDGVAWQARDGLWRRDPLKRARIRIRLAHATAQRYDPDNAVAVVKPLVDGLKGRVIVDDSPEHITLEVTQETDAGRGCYIEVYPWEGE